MRSCVVLACLIALVAPARAAAALYDLEPGEAFTVAGTREGCWSRATPATPLLTCSLWGRTTRIVPGTLYFELGQSVADVFQRTLGGDAGLLREFPQPLQQAQPPPAQPVGPGVFLVQPGDTVSVSGTDIGCAVAKRNDDLGVTCRKLERGTGLPLSTSVAVTLSEVAVTATRIRADRSGSTSFVLAQPFLPSGPAVTQVERNLRGAIRRLAAIRRIEPGFGEGSYRSARTGLGRALGQLENDRFATACLTLEPLLYEGFGIPRGHTRMLFVRRMRKIYRAFC